MRPFKLPRKQTKPSRQAALRGCRMSSTKWLTTAGRWAYVVFNHSVEEGASVADDQLSRIFAALADPTRRDMVARLAVGDATVGELADPYDVSVQAVCKPLKALAAAG